MTKQEPEEALPWWQTEVLYQIYPRSFADSNGDGVGDLRGIIAKLDYLEWLGIGGIWLNPVTDSPNVDWGYDVSDYRSVHPELGSMADVEELIAAAGERNMRIIFDIVPNHTSDRHPWFLDALSDRNSEFRDYYVWADPQQDGSPPNNWLSVFDGPAWEWHEATGQFYLHNFTDGQPDLDWWNDDVRREFEDILRFWFDKGVAGFRIDVAHSLIKDRDLRDNLMTSPDDHSHQRELTQAQTYSMNRPEVHDIFRSWRKLADSYEPERVLIGETFVYDLNKWAEFYGGGTDELNLCFNFPFALGRFDPEEMKQVVRVSEELIPPEAWPVWMASNHDIMRAMTRWCDGDEDRSRLLIMLLLTLRGTPFIYYGEEIGMPDVQLERDQLRDPVGIQRWPQDEGRDACRTPMQWSDEAGAGFTAGGVEPWLPFGDFEKTNVARQRSETDSHLGYIRHLIRARKNLPGLQAGGYEEIDSPLGTWVFRRGDDTVVALNFSDELMTIEGVRGPVRLTTAPGRIDEHAPGQIDLQPLQGVVMVED
ncbi:MAG: alpha-amylase family glycosyl hydrolase [Actinomycetota bacterium]